MAQHLYTYIIRLIEISDGDDSYAKPILYLILGVCDNLWLVQYLHSFIVKFQ